MKNLIWNCKSGEGTSLTVGQKFTVSCNGPLENLNLENLVFKRADSKEEETPSLTLLSFSSPNEGVHELVVTSYQVGDHKSEEVYLFDGQSAIQIEGITWKVTSVVPKGPPPQPFPAYPAWEMSYPIWFWILAVLFFVALFGTPVLIYKRLQERKKSYDSLKDLETVFEPIDQLYRDLRKIEKNLSENNIKESSENLAKDFKVYLARSLQIPFHARPEKKCFRDLKRKHFRIYRDFAVKLKKYFFELHFFSESFKKNKSTLEDFDLIREKAQKLSEQIDSYLNPRGQR